MTVARVELAERQERVRDFRKGAILVPVVIRFLLADNFPMMSKWGGDQSWQRRIFERMGVSILEQQEIGEIIGAGMSQVGYGGDVDLSRVVGRAEVLVMRNTSESVESYRARWMLQAVKATIMALDVEGYDGNLGLVEGYLSNDKEIFQMVWEALDLEESVGNEVWEFWANMSFR